MMYAHDNVEVLYSIGHVDTADWFEVDIKSIDACLQTYEGETELVVFTDRKDKGEYLSSYFVRELSPW